MFEAMLDQVQSDRTLKITAKTDLPDWLSFEDLATFLHTYMKPYEDSLADVERGLHDALSSKEDSTGGFILLAENDQELMGAVVVLNTGMTGYIPENILLFACVHPDSRGQGLGGKLIKRAVEECKGSMKLHVEYDNPAKKLYERLGFNNKYAEMRYTKEQA